MARHTARVNQQRLNDQFFNLAEALRHGLQSSIRRGGVRDRSLLSLALYICICRIADKLPGTMQLLGALYLDHIDPCAFGIQISNVSFPNLLIFSCSPLFPANFVPTDCVVALKTLLQGQLLNICIDRDGTPTFSIFKGDMTQLEHLRVRIVYQSL